MRAAGGIAAVALLSVACSSADESGGPSPATTRPVSACAAVGDGGVLRTRSGELRGFESGPSCAFLGVPYAEPPVDDLRWRPPRTLPTRLDPVDATGFGPACPQPGPDGTTLGSEDCLRLNVWVPPGESDPRPVLVFFRGGGNVFGSSSDPRWDGASLAARGDVVVVSFDYRLGALGYLAHEALSAESPTGTSGNYGLLDQMAALEWIREHAGAFGGDASRIVAFGQSAGARNLCTLLTVPSAATLLSGAMLQSGACNPRTLEETEGFGRQFELAAGCAGSADRPACLRALPVESVVHAMPGIPGPMTSSEYNPNVDGQLVVGPPIERLAVGATPPVPVIVGTNSEEVERVMPRVTDAAHYRTLLKVIFGADRVDAVLAAYPPGDHASPRHALTAAITDARYTCPARTTARALARSRRTYRYFFTHGADRDAEPAAHHELELVFLFGTFEAAGIDPTTREIDLSDELAAAYARFARTGEPEAVGSTAWPAFTSAEQRHVVVDVPPAMGSSLRDAQCDFWDALEQD